MSWTSCNALFNTSLRDNSELDAFHSKLMSVTMYKHLRGVSAFVSILTYSLAASPSCVHLGELLAISAFDPAQARTRESENGDVNLVSRSHKADDEVWVGHEKALDKTTSATGKILLDPVCRKAMENIDGQSNRGDVANVVFPLKVDTPAVPLMETSCSQLGSDTKFLMFIPVECPDVQFCVKECARGVQDLSTREMQRAKRICRYLMDKASAKVPVDFVCSSVFREGVEIKSAMGADGVPPGFMGLDCGSHSIERNAEAIWKVPMSVFQMKTFESGTKLISKLEPAKQAMEAHRSDLLAVSERNEDLERFFRAEIAGVEHRMRVMETQRSVVNEPHEDSEQSFRAEPAIVEEGLRTVKEIKGHTRNSQAIECVERSENVESQTDEVGESEFNVIEFVRVTDLMLWCGLTNTDASRKAERAYVNTTSILVSSDMS